MLFLYYKTKGFRMTIYFQLVAYHISLLPFPIAKIIGALLVYFISWYFPSFKFRVREYPFKVGYRSKTLLNEINMAVEYPTHVSSAK